MKNISLFTASIIALILQGCVSITDEPVAGKGDICLTVNTPVQSRAGLTVPEGYTMRCILQLVDSNGNKVGDQKINTLIGSTTTFTISSEEQTNATTALFWADYLKDGVSFYNTSDLKSITYNTTTFETSQTVALDAFCNKLVLGGGTSVTLYRPFVKVSFVPENTGVVAGTNNLKVVYNAPSSFSVLTSETSSQKQSITLNNTSFDPEVTPWFSTFLFGAAGDAKYDDNISIQVSGGTNGRTFTIPAGHIDLATNHIVNVGTTLSRDAIELTVTIQPGYDDSGNSGKDPDEPTIPDTPVTPAGEFKVGAYIDSNGNVTTNKDNVVAVVFYEGALSPDVISAYPDKYAGKTIKGYAVALNNVSDTPQRIEQSDIAPLINGAYINGYQKSVKLFDLVGSSCNFTSTYNDWKAANSVMNSVNNGITSGWYVPDDVQMKTWLDLLYGTSTSSVLKAEFPESNITPGNNDAIYATSSGENDNTLITFTVRYNSNTVGKTSLDMINGESEDFLLLCRPMLTIFE